MVVKQPQKIDVTEYDRLLASKPLPGQILREKSGLFVPVITQARENGQVVMFCNCVVDSAGTGWYLHDQRYGLKAMIVRESHQAVYDLNCGITPLLVDALRVIRLSDNRSTLICELVAI